MSLTVSSQLLSGTKAAAFEGDREHAKHMRGDREHTIDTADLDEDALQDLIAAATAVADGKTARAAESILLARAGNFDKVVPNFKAFRDVLRAYLLKDMIDGWVYVSKHDGKMYPELVTEIAFDSGQSMRGAPHPTVNVHTVSYGYSTDGNYRSKFGVQRNTHTFSPQDAARRRIADILSGSGIFKETQALKDAHVASLARHREVTQGAFAEQFRVTGGVYVYEEDNYSRRGTPIKNRRVIHDLPASECGAVQLHIESDLFDRHPTAQGVGAIPEHPIVRAFDLRTHEFFWVHADTMSPYAYDKSLRDKLILPQSHRDLLDVLTTDLGAFVDDIIEGKSAGNVILCKGIAGVGKTLTAEVYAELIERPLYSIHSGNLGTTAEDIDKNLQVVFQRSKRWNCVLLLDEADVFVVKRGANNIQQNAIVAEFLRTLEYFDGLMFMTTNRPDDIDDAIVSRCAAIIGYEPPAKEGAALIWKVMATQYGAEMPTELLHGLLELFPIIAPRDIKMLLRLALRVSTKRTEPLDLDTFRRCAMFRAIEMKPNK
jgi:hypothetical protein